MTISVSIHRLPHGADLPLPEYATSHAAGLDLLAAIETDLVIKPMQRILVPTGIAIALPEGYEAQIRARSGLAFKHGIALVNAPGTIDADYRGEIKALIINLGHENFTVTRGMRIAQMVIAPVSKISWQEVQSLDESARGQSGFGSTGTHAKKVSA